MKYHTDTDIHHDDSRIILYSDFTVFLFISYQLKRMQDFQNTGTNYWDCKENTFKDVPYPLHKVRSILKYYQFSKLARLYTYNYYLLSVNKACK